MKQIKPFENFRINEAEATRLPNGSMHKDPVTGKSKSIVIPGTEHGNITKSKELAQMIKAVY
jgi:hypothetical protein